jgi:hypothetical protein
LERLGDAYIRCIAQYELRNIFGAKNYILITRLLDHANSNAFFHEVTNYYRLDTWVKFPPNYTWMGNIPKLKADIFEAWIGGYIYERLQYDDRDSFYELRYFLNRLWSLRYAGLMHCRHSPSLNPDNLPRGSIQCSTIFEVKLKSDDDIKRTLGPQRGPNIHSNQTVGYIVQVQIAEETEDGDPRARQASKLDKNGSYTSFALSEKEAGCMADLILWTNPGKNFHISPPSLIGRNRYATIPTILGRCPI